MESHVHAGAQLDSAGTAAPPGLSDPELWSKARALKENISRVFRGSELAVERIIVALFANGHLLIEDVPGVGKTTLAQSLARSLDCPFRRIQFTPDLLPSDVLGVSIYRPESDRWVFSPGPIFTSVLLADEINRTNPRTQAALLEAMSEEQVTLDGETRPLPRPFIVLATQNPFESEGTYPLPDSQLDRFMIRLELGYPQLSEERGMLDAQAVEHPLQRLQPILDASHVLAIQERVRRVHVDSDLLDHLVAFAQRSREHPDLTVGLSPRGTLAFRRAAQALAVVRGREFVKADDFMDLLGPVCAHRVIAGRSLRHRVRPERQTQLQSLLEDLYHARPVPL
jgi:MoxR-like ATPase